MSFVCCHVASMNYSFPPLSALLGECGTHTEYNNKPACVIDVDGRVAGIKGMLVSLKCTSNFLSITNCDRDIYEGCDTDTGTCHLSIYGQLELAIPFTVAALALLVCFVVAVFTARMFNHHRDMQARRGL